MYSNFFFLLLVFLIPSLSQGSSTDGILSEKSAFFLGLLAYAFTLFLIILQKNLLNFKKNIMLQIVNIELIAFLLIYFFILNANRLFYDFSLFQFFSATTALFFYLTGLWFFYCSEKETKNAVKKISFLFPFVIPFLIFSLFMDLFFSSLTSYPTILLNSMSPMMANILLIATFLIIICLMMIFFPFLIQWLWRCRPLREENEELAQKLEGICEKAHFKHAGIKTWEVLNDSLTAAIIGVIPQIRYIIFTKKILQKLSFNALSAVLAHEIGHSYRKHLLFYPFIFLGLFFILNGFENSFEDSLPPFLFFIIYVLAIALYFRFVFGFFSRIFEREADLQVYVLNINPQFMIEALDRIATLSGSIHLVPCWHHYSIQERINFLQKTIQNPKLIEKHHLFVKKALFFYFILLILLLLIYTL